MIINSFRDFMAKIHCFWKWLYLTLKSANPFRLLSLLFTELSIYLLFSRLPIFSAITHSELAWGCRRINQIEEKVTKGGPYIIWSNIFTFCLQFFFFNLQWEYLAYFENSCVVFLWYQCSNPFRITRKIVLLRKSTPTLNFKPTEISWCFHLSFH